MTEKDPKKETVNKEAETTQPAHLKNAGKAPGAVFNNENTVPGNAAEILDKKLRGMASENLGITQRVKPASAQDIFRAQEKVEKKKSAARTLGLTLLAVFLAAGIGYPTKLAYEGKLETRQLATDYKLLQVTITAIQKRNYDFYKKLFPQVGELETARVDSALKGIEDNIDLAAKMNADADELWGREQYDQALELYDRAAKISPLKDRSAYFAKESALAKRDQEQFKRFYIVQKDDTLESVAQRANISELRIINANGPKYTALYQGRLIKGMQLALPVSIKRGQQSR